MTKLLEQALEVARNLPSDVQDDIARVVLQLAGADDFPPVPLTNDERAAIARSKEAAARGEFATDEQVRSHLGETRPVRIRYTLPALADLNSILDYISEFFTARRETRPSSESNGSSDCCLPIRE